MAKISQKWNFFEKEWAFQEGKIKIPDHLAVRKLKVQSIVQEQKKKFFLRQEDQMILIY